MATDLPEWLISTLSCITFIESAFAILTGLYGNFRLYRNINQQFMRPRCFTLQMITNFSLLISIMATCAALQAQLSSSSVSFMTYSKPDSEESPGNIFLMCFGDVLLITCYNIFICCILTTSWLIFYREKWQFYSLQEQWQCIIRREAASLNWFVVHNQHFGSKRFVAKAVGGYHLLSCMTSTVGIVCHHLEKIPRVISAMMAALPVLISVAFYVWVNVQTLQMRLVDDVWFVHWERVTIGKLLTVFIFMYTVQQIVMYILSISTLLCSLIFSPMFVMVTYAIHYVSTFAIMNKNSSDTEKNKRLDFVHTVEQIGTVEMRPMKSTVAMINRGHWTSQSHPAEGTNTATITSAIRAKCSFAPKRANSVQQTQHDVKHLKKRRPEPTKCALTGSPARCNLGGSGSARDPHHELNDNVDSNGDDCGNTLSAVANRKQDTHEMDMEVVVQEPCKKTKPIQSNKRGNSPTTRRPITFSRLLAKDDLLHLFMLHLSREFNMECLLAYIEMTQYQTLALNQLDLQLDQDLYYLVPFSNNLPISSIVEYSTIMEHLPTLVKMGIEFNCHDLEHDLKMKARRLFMKYMAPGCEYECNISGRLRSRAIRMLCNQRDLFLSEDITVRKIFLLFEDVKNELARFLHPSFYAFKHTKDWIIVQNLLNLD